MIVEQLLVILKEYPPSLRLDVIVEGQIIRRTTVIEMCIKLMSQRPSALLIFYACPNCIVRERGERTEDVAGAPPYRQWLELDMR